MANPINLAELGQAAGAHLFGPEAWEKRVLVRLRGVRALPGKEVTTFAVTEAVIDGDGHLVLELDTLEWA